jgi:hypothetical protein
MSQKVLNLPNKQKIDMLNDDNVKNFLNSIEPDIREATALIPDLEDYHKTTGKFDDEKKQFDELMITFYIDRAVKKIQFILEYLNLKELLAQFKDDISKYKNEYMDFEYIPYVGVLNSPVVSLLRNYVEAITCVIPGKNYELKKKEEDIALLERILLATPKILKDRNVLPKNEAEVRQEIYSLLIHVFPSTVREFSIPKELTNYKPDIGVKSLKCAIEYKFVTTEEETRKFIGEIYEDMMAYDGSEDWKIFYAVIYMTDNYVTQAQVDSQVISSNGKNTWKVILVYGKGEREKRSLKKKA